MTSDPKLRNALETKFQVLNWRGDNVLDGSPSKDLIDLNLIESRYESSGTHSSHGFVAIHSVRPPLADTGTISSNVT